MPFSFPLPEKDITHSCYFSLTTLFFQYFCTYWHIWSKFFPKNILPLYLPVFTFEDFYPQFHKLLQKLSLHPVLYIFYKNIVNIIAWRFHLMESWLRFIIITFHCNCVYFLLLLYTILNNSYRGLMWTVFQIREQLITKTKLYMPRVVTTARY